MGSEKARRIEILNLKREFDILRMKDNKIINEHTDRFIEVVDKIRLYGEELSDQSVQKVLVSLPKRFESTISSLENSKDLSQISLFELVHDFQAQEQRILIRQETNNDRAFVVKQKGKAFKWKEEAIQ